MHMISPPNPAAVASRSSIASRLAVPVVLFLVALVIRWPFLGHPMIHVDEQFYLLAGQRMTESWLPYVDFWDRKPVGLFLIYGAIRMLGGDGILQYQIVATAFAAATAFAVYLIARRGAPKPASIAAGIAYCAMLAPINGAGGQSPVFYNLFMACSALMVLRAGDLQDMEDYRRRGLAAMLCAGMAMQIKYTAAIEGMFFGLWLLYRGNRHGGGLVVTISSAALFAAAALLPTLLVTAWFAATGALEPFLRANFISIFQRAAAPGWFERDALAHTVRMILLPLVCTVGAWAISWLRGGARDRLFLLLWMAFAMGGFFAIGNYYDHYALPLLVPIAVVLSRLFAVRVGGPLMFGLLLLQATIFGLFRYSPTAEGRAVVAAMTARIAPVADAGECLFVADTPIILYLTSRACGPWRYSFPFHLIDATEVRSGDRDQPHAMRAILAARPGAIVTGSPHFPPTVQQDNVALLERTLDSDYIVAGRYPDRGRTYTVWIRRDLAPAARRHEVTGTPRKRLNHPEPRSSPSLARAALGQY